MRIRSIHPSDFGETASLIHAALDTYYRTHLNDSKFGTDPAPFLLFPDLYDELDPGCGLVAEGAEGSLLGCAFYHPRPTHVGIGIVATHPTSSNKGIARALMEEILRQSDLRGVPACLVSSAMNLASFSLYTRLGFVPTDTLQDVSLKVPHEGLSFRTNPNLHIRPSQPRDIPELTNLEKRLRGIDRAKDLAHFQTNAKGCWRLMVAEEEGHLVGFLGGIAHPGLRMLGPGVAESETVMAGLVHAQLDAHFRGEEVLWLVPVKCSALVSQAYQWGARNVEIHLTSIRGSRPEQAGINIPTFMPESG